MKTFLKIFLLSLLIIIGLGFSSNILAGGLSGWAWSENVGWISFNCRNQNTCATVDYGVRIAADGNLIGHAWSSNIGWIDFDPAGPFPAAPNWSARIDNPTLATSTLSGWARALAHDAAWSGWIKMSGPNYGVTVNFITDEFSGWAWSDAVVGWISFNCEDRNICPTSNYRVIILNTPPEATNLTTTADHCRAPQRYTFSWTFHDPDLGDTQSAFRLQVATSTIDIGVGPYTIDRTVSSNVSSYAPLDLFAWNTTYNWRVMVWDSQNATSAWSAITSFTTPVHRLPHVRFTWDPPRPAVNEVVQFENTSQCFGPGGSPFGTAHATCTWAWYFDAGDTIDSTLQNPTTTFATIGQHTIRLTATDPGGTGNPALSCTTTRVIRVTRPPV